MLVAPLMLWTLGGCSDVQDLVGDWFGGDDAPVEAAPPGAAPAAPAAPLDATKRAMKVGHYDDAVAAAEKALAAHPETDEAWDLAELAAVRARAAGALLDRLAADQAIGGRVDRHMALRARLAIAAGRPADALIAAQALRASDPGGADAYTVRAVRLGAPSPAELSPVASGLLAAFADPAVVLAPEVTAAQGPEMARLRAELARGRGDQVGADAELAAVAAAPAGSVPMAVRLAASMERIALGVSPDAVLTDGKALVAALVELGDLADGAILLAATIPAAAVTGQLGAVSTAAADLQKTATDAKGEEPVAFAAAAVAEAALRSGQPQLAITAATVASATAGTKARGQWTLALAHATLGDAAAVQADATGLPGDRVRAVRDLASAMRGDDPTLPSEGLTGDDALTQGILALGWLADPGPACARLGAMPGSADLTLTVKLACGRGSLAVTPADPAPLRAEAQVRGWLATGESAALADITHPLAGGWSTALAGAVAPGAVALPPVGRLRAAIAAGDAATAAAAIGDAAMVVPDWRTGPLAPLLVLDGATPRDVLAEAGRLEGLKDNVAVVTAMHGWAHRYDRRTSMWSHGAGPFGGAATAEQRAAVFAAAAAVRAGAVQWVLGKGAWPTDAQKALDDAAKAAGLTSEPLPTLQGLRGTLGKAAAISVLPLPGGVQVLYIAAEHAEVHTLPASVAMEVSDFVAGVQGGHLDVRLGDRIRGQMLDVASGTLLGVGSYVVVGGDGAAMLPVAHLPEQGDGRRFLAAIRHVTHVPDLDSVAVPAAQVVDYPVTALALCANAEEAALFRRHFPDAVVKTGAEATVAAWKADAGRARFLEIGAFPAAPGGGFVLPGNEILTIGDLVDTPSQAMAAVVRGSAPPADSIARAAALRQAGVDDVLVHLWSATADFETTLLSSYWDAVSRRRQATRAFDEARGQSIKMSPEGSAGPEHWGSWLLLSAP